MGEITEIPMDGVEYSRTLGPVTESSRQAEQERSMTYAARAANTDPSLEETSYIAEDSEGTEVAEDATATLVPSRDDRNVTEEVASEMTPVDSPKVKVPPPVPPKRLHHTNSAHSDRRMRPAEEMEPKTLLGSMKDLFVGTVEAPEIREMRAMRHEIKLHRVEIKKLYKDIEHRGAWIQHLQTEVEVRNAGLDKLQRETHNLRANLETATRKLEEYENEQQGQLDSVLQVQQSAFHITNQGPWIPDEDSATVQKLSKLQRAVRDWSREHHALLDFEKLANDPEALELARRIGKVSQKINGVPVVLLQGNLERKAVPLVLIACVNDYICWGLYEDPFFFLRLPHHGQSKEERRSRDRAEPPSIFESVRRFTHTLSVDVEQYDPIGANTWRAQTLRLLDPPRQNPNGKTSVDELKASTQSARAFASSNMCSRLLDAYLRPLVKDAKNPALRAGLEKIFFEAGELAYSLGTQKRSLVCHSIDELPKTFTTECMEPHPLHNQQLDEDETALDGRPILLVVSPVISMEGNTDGTRYDQRTVLRKAVVLVDVRSGVEK